MRRWTAMCVAAVLAFAALATTGVSTATATTAPSPNPSQTPAPASGSSGVSQADMATLVGSVPISHRYQCSLTDPNTAGSLLGPELGHIRAFLECYGVNGMRLYWYALFDDNASLDRAYRAYAGTYDPDAPYEDENARCPGESGWGFNGATDQGLLACYYSGSDVSGNDYGGETAVLIWKYDRTRILALAQSQIGDDNASAMKQWWENDSGPLQAPEADKSLVDWQVVNKPAEKTLLSHIPRRFRPSCRVQRGATNGSFYSVRFLVTARAACKSGNITVVYASMTPSITGPFMQKYHDIVPSDNAPCPDTGDWWTGSGETRHVQGEYACWGNPEFDGTTTAQIVWSHNTLGIVAVAALPTGDADYNRMWDWWDTDVGPT